MASRRALLYGANGEELTSFISHPGGTYIPQSETPEEHEKARFWGVYMAGNPASFNQDVFSRQSNSIAHGFVYQQDSAFYDLCDEMVAKNTTISAALELLVCHVFRRGGDFQIPKERQKDPLAQEINKVIRQDLCAQDVFDHECLKTTMVDGTLRHGFSPNELAWGIRDRKRLGIAGYIHRHPSMFDFGPLGEPLLRIGTEPTPAPADKFVIMRAKALYGNPFGSSAIFNLRWLYEFTREAIKAWVDACETYGIPFAAAKLPPDATPEIISETDKILASMRRRTGFRLPEGVEVTFTSRMGSQNKLPHIDIIEHGMRESARTLLGSVSHFMEQQYGNRATSEVSESQTEVKLRPIAQNFDARYNRGVTDVYLRRNWGDRAIGAVQWVTHVDDGIAIDTLMKKMEIAGKFNVPLGLSQIYEWLDANPPAPNEPVALWFENRLEQWHVQEGVASREEVRTQNGLQGPPPERPQPEEKPAGLPVLSQPDVRIFSDAKTYDFATVQIGLPDSLAGLCREWAKENIAPEDVYTETRGDGSTRYGFEDTPHVTVLYGLTSEDPGAAVKALAEFGPVALTFGGLAFFSREDKPFDVLYVSVYGTDIRRLRKAVEELDHEDLQAAFTPHATLAYLKKGTAEKYVLEGERRGVSGPLDSHTVRVYSVEHSGKTGQATEIPLVPEAAAREREPDDDGEVEPAPVQSFADFPDLTEDEKTAIRNEERIEQMARKVADLLEEEDARPEIRTALSVMAGQIRKDLASSLSDTVTAGLESALNPVADFLPLATRLTACAMILGALSAELSLGPLGDDVEQFSDKEPPLPEDIQSAVDWFRTRKVMSESELSAAVARLSKMRGSDPAAIERSLRQQALILADGLSQSLMKKVRDYLAAAVEQGLTVEEFLEAIAESEGGLTPAQEAYWRMVFRTEMAKAYSHEQMRNESDPTYQVRHWGWVGWNPVDEKSRPTHAAVKGVYFKRDSQASRVLGRPPFAYNCRCMLVPLMIRNLSRPGYGESPNALSVAQAVQRW